MFHIKILQVDGFRIYFINLQKMQKLIRTNGQTFASKGITNINLLFTYPHLLFYQKEKVTETSKRHVYLTLVHTQDFDIYKIYF